MHTMAEMAKTCFVLSELLVQVGEAKTNRNRIDHHFCPGELHQHPAQMFLEPVSVFRRSYFQCVLEAT